MSEEYEYDDEEVEYYAIRPNKTQIKKDMAVLFALSEEMSELPAGQLKTLELPPSVQKAFKLFAYWPFARFLGKIGKDSFAQSQRFSRLTR